jgi:hypothetical protein
MRHRALMLTEAMAVAIDKVDNHWMALEQMLYIALGCVVTESYTSTPVKFGLRRRLKE